jgi:hypothetical protein
MAGVMSHVAGDGADIDPTKRSGRASGRPELFEAFGIRCVAMLSISRQSRYQSNNDAQIEQNKRYSHQADAYELIYFDAKDKDHS